MPGASQRIFRIPEIYEADRNQLSAASAMLSGYGEADLERFIRMLEIEIESKVKAAGEFRFHYPFDNPESAALNRLRAVSRRVERHWWKLQETRKTDPSLGVYLNRISDYFMRCRFRVRQVRKFKYRRKHLDYGISQGNNR